MRVDRQNLRSNVAERSEVSHRQHRHSSGDRQRSRFAASGLVTAAILVVGLLIFGAYWQAHRRAAFHRLRTRETAPAPVTPMPGGLEAVTLTRLSMQDETAPAFVSAVVLPGVGMQLQQAIISVPGHGNTAIVQGPSLAEAAAMPPTALQTSPIHLYVSNTPFAGHQESTAADLIGTAPATDVETETLPDGTQVSAKFPAVLPATPDVGAAVTAVLNGHVLDLNVSAKNNASSDRYVAFQWKPRFSLAGQNPSTTMLTLPSRQLWNGSTQSAAAAAMDFASIGGKPLTTKPIDATLVNLHTEILADGPAVKIVDLQNGTLLRVTGSNPDIRTLRVVSDPVAQTLTLSFESIDPTPDGNRGGELLHPGKSMQWHIRIEVLPNATASKQAAASAFE